MTTFSNITLSCNGTGLHIGPSAARLLRSRGTRDTKMTELSGLKNPEKSGGLDAISRRRMLKGAAAVGAGAVAWSAPNITTLGFTPAYAQVCTVPTNSYVVSARNTSCDCCSNPDTSAKYKEFSGNCGGVLFPGTAILTETSCAGDPIGNNGTTPGNSDAGCVPVCGGDPGVCVTPNDLTLACRVVIELISNGSCSNNFVLPTITTAAAVGQSWHPLPELRRDLVQNCSFFIRINVECSTDIFCLT